MKPRLGCEHYGNGHREPASKRRMLHRKSTEQHGYRQRDFGRKPGIFFMPSPISECDQGDDAYGCDRKHCLAANEEADGGKRSNSKRSYSGRRTQWARTLATFPLGADQEAGPQCDGEVQDHGSMMAIPPLSEVETPP
jgi:hypothetical protein